MKLDEQWQVNVGYQLKCGFCFQHFVEDCRSRTHYEFVTHKTCRRLSWINCWSINTSYLESFYMGFFNLIQVFELLLICLPCLFLVLRLGTILFSSLIDKGVFRFVVGTFVDHLDETYIFARADSMTLKLFDAGEMSSDFKDGYVGNSKQSSDICQRTARHLYIPHPTQCDFACCTASFLSETTSKHLNRAPSEHNSRGQHKDHCY